MRTVDEWIGKTDDSMPPASVKDRIIERQNKQCAISGYTFKSGDKIEFDHKIPLWLGGKNSETNLQAVLAETHAKKTKTEATVRAKINRLRQKDLGIFPKPKGNSRIQSRGFNKRAEQ